MKSFPFKAWILPLIVAATVAAGAVQGLAQEGAAISNGDCAMCHNGDDASIPAVTEASLSQSSHAGLSCMDCHADIAEIPHAEKLARVQCGTCHSSESETYTQHGRGIVGTTEDLPECQDCHGSHNILPSSDNHSQVHPTNLSQTCAVCHANLDLAKKHDIKLKRAVAVYEASVHGRAAMGGIYTAATCTDCHSTEGTAHRILGPGDATSSINHFNIPKTCGKCHRGIEQDYEEGIHGQLAARGETDTPVCTTCHGEHGILATDDPRSNVSPTLVAEATCAPCHESAQLNEKYGIPAGRLASFVDSYHGLKSRSGDPTVANCASCHGAHRILPSANPQSSIYPANLQKTCGHCHPNISTQLAQTQIHSANAGLQTGWSRFFAVVYTILIIAVIGGMLVYVLIDLRARYREMLARPQIRRMDTNAILQHSVLTAAFIVLVVTGFALRYSEAWIFNHIFGWDGGFRVRGIIHRSAAVLLVLGSLWHLLYLRTHNGRKFGRGMLPSLEDAKQLLHMVQFNLGRRKDHPHFDRFTYVEKAEYWALIWGTVVMAITGFFLWFDNLAVSIFHKGFLDVMLVIHFYEAWLATLAIALWHFYFTVFRPGAYPGNPAWVTGKMPADLYHDEHPADTSAPMAEPAQELYPDRADAAGKKQA